MTKDIEEYYNNIKYINDRIAFYRDDEGNMIPLRPSDLLVAVQYVTLNKQDYERAVFEQLIPKDIICNEIEIDKIVPKSDITKNPKDQTTLTTIKQKAKEVWIVIGGMGLKKAYNTKEQANEVADRINQKILEVCKIDIQ